MKKQILLSFLVILFSVAVLTGCDTGSNNAPVINANAIDSNSENTDQDNNVEVVPTNDIQVVNKSADNSSVGESNNDQNYQNPPSHHEVAHHNYHVTTKDDYNSSQETVQPQHHEKHHAHHVKVKNIKKTETTPPVAQKTGWAWPATGSVMTEFSESHPGIEISGDLGEAITAVAAGTVIYSQDNVTRYGNMIIIDHGNHLLTAYAYNQTLLVQPGQQVVAGQKIATMGKDSENKSGLYFEVRHNGKPVDPLKYLSKTP